MKKRILAMLLLAAMVMSLFTACGGDTTPTGGNDDSAKVNFTVPEGGYDGSAVEIRFYHTMGQNLREVLDAYIVEFNKLYPNITIVSEQVGNYDDVREQISTEIPAGNQPNIAYCYPDHVALYNLAGAVTTLDSLIDSQVQVTRADGSTEILGLTQEQKDDFIEGYYNEGKQFGDGLMYTLPPEQVHRGSVLQQDLLRRQQPHRSHHLGRAGGRLRTDQGHRPRFYPSGL